MQNMFEPVRVEGKLVAKCMETGSIQPDGFIRYIQLNTAEKNNQVIMVTETGRAVRVANTTTSANAEPAKLSFSSVIQNRNPQVMFDQLENLTRMVGKGIQPSLVVTGMAGMGKTHIVKETLKEMGMQESQEFVHFKGRATAAGLFITLYENDDKIIILDDCDSVFKNDDAVNLLKAALDSYDTRRISYITSKPLKDADGNPLPHHFTFTGRIIFISNISQSRLDEAVKSRSFVADISMNTEQMFERMTQLMPVMEPTISMPVKEQALEIMRSLHSRYRGVDINLRSFIKAARIVAMGFENPEMAVAEQIIPA